MVLREGGENSVNDARKAFVEQYKDFRVDVPEGSHMLTEVRRKTMSKLDAKVSNIMGYVTKTGRFAFPGTYTQLVYYGKNGNPYDEIIMMTDHHCEVADHEPIVTYARENAPLDHVLINGLGLGVAIELLMPYVKKITNIEISSSVIKLVGSHYQARYGNRLEIIQHDALTYQPPKGIRYNAVFHDIWYTISHEHLPQMKELHRKYGRICDWQQSWARVYCERELRKRKRHPEQYENEVDVRELFSSINTIFSQTMEER